MPKVLLHVGLPKTATTALQLNVLRPLSAARRLNYITELDFRGIQYWGAKRMDAFRLALGRQLDPDRLNVFSRENRFVMVHPGEDAAVRFRKARRLLAGHDVKVLVSLRSPVDFVLAYYAQGARWSRPGQPQYRSFDTFVRWLLEDGERHRTRLMFFYDDYLRAIGRHFDDIEVLLYEDLEHDRPYYFSRLAACLAAEPEEIERLFAAVRRNVGDVVPGGRRTGPLPLRSYIWRYLVRYVPGLKPYRAKPIPLLRWLTEPLSWIELTPRVARYADAETRRRVQALLGLRDDYLTRVHGVSAEKLRRYGYLCPSRGGSAAAAEGR